MDFSLVTTLLGGIMVGMFSQTIAVWVALGNIKKTLAEQRASLEKKIVETRCPFGECPLYERARDEAAQGRIVKNSGNQ